MKNILEYDRFVHYGCSFTLGYDSGGTGIHDVDLSYPAHMSRIIGNAYLNRGISSGSNDSAFVRLCVDIHNGTFKGDIFKGDSLIVINLTKPVRTMYYGESGSSKIEFGEHEVNYENVLPNHSLKRRWVNLVKFASSYYDQTEEAYYFNTIKNIVAITELCRQQNLPVIFIDLFSDLRTNHDKDINFFNKFNTIDLSNIVLCKNEYNLCFVNHILRLHQEYLSETKHCTSDGYKFLAETVYDHIKDIEC